MADMESNHRGYVIAWQEPPATTAQWDFTVASDDPNLQRFIGKSAHAISAPSREAGFNAACAYIDSLLDR